MDYQKNLDYEKSIGLLWARDWEFFFRASDILWPKLLLHPEVSSRRNKYNSKFDRFDGSTSDYEASRFSNELDPICDIVGTRWGNLFDAWEKEPNKFIFEDGFAALFLVRLLWAKNKVLLRGHYNSSWTLISSLERAKQNENKSLEMLMGRAQIFIEQASSLDVVQMAYGAAIPENHKQAILQHYGFPTELLDCTYSYDVALFFAEGAKDSIPVSPEASEYGSIYAFPAYVLPKEAVIVSLPPAIMRTSLQRGVFISNLTSDDIQLLEEHKFTFKHKKLPVWNGLGDIPFGAPIGLSRYLFPIVDPLEIIAEPLRNDRSSQGTTDTDQGNKRLPTLSETPEGVWIGEVLQNCVIEKAEGYQTIDMNLLIQMCKNEPKSALIALSIFSDNIMKLLNGKPVEEADGFAINLRLLIGSITTGYMISQGNRDGIAPDELVPVVTRYPIIKDCLNYVLMYNKDNFKD